MYAFFETRFTKCEEVSFIRIRSVNVCVWGQGMAPELVLVVILMIRFTNFISFKKQIAR